MAMPYPSTLSNERRSKPAPDGSCCTSGSTLYTVPVFTTVFVAMFVLILSVTGYLGGVLSTLQRRFQLSSSEVGGIVIVNDAVSLSLVIFVSHFGHTKHRPRLIAIGGVLGGIGAIVMGMPQFIYTTPDFEVASFDYYNDGDTDVSIESEDLCFHGNGNNSGDICNENQPSYSALLDQVAFVIIGRAFIGLSNSVMFPLAITFIDDNVRSTSTAMYIGIIFASTGLAPVVGFGLSAMTLRYHTDFYRTDQSSLSITSDDPNWMGAWWLGFIIIGVVILVLTIPVFMFPKDLPGGNNNVTGASHGAKDDQTRDEGVIHIASAYRPSSVKIGRKEDCFAALKGFLDAVKRLLTNAVYLLVVIAICLSVVTVSGLTAFAGKYFEVQYGTDPTFAPILVGSFIAPGLLIGCILGGYIVRALKLNVLQCAQMVLATITPVAFSYTILLFIGCDNLQVAGVTTTYAVSDYSSQTHLNNATDFRNEDPGLTSQCNRECDCRVTYSPVCGVDGVTYITPCHAGCHQHVRNFSSHPGMRKKKIFTNCTCVGPIPSMSHHSALEDLRISPNTARRGECPRDCSYMMWIFAGIVGCLLLCNSLGSSAEFMLYLRAVEERDRSLAVGMAMVLMKAIGFIPGPVCYGAAIQSTCLVWQNACDKNGACLVYDIQSFRHIFIGLTMAVTFLAVVLLVCTYVIIKRKDTENSSKRSENPASKESNIAEHSRFINEETC